MYKCNFDLSILREAKYGRSPENNLAWYSASLGVFPIQISTQNISQCNINELGDLCATGKKIEFYVRDITPKLWPFVLICTTVCVFINLVCVCFAILFYALNTGYS